MRLPVASDVWIVDDELPTLNFLARALQGDGRSVVCCSSADELRARLIHDVPACLVTDLRLGVQNGLDLVYELWRTVWPVPSILISGHLNIPLAVEAVRSGLLSVLEKPVSMELLRQEVGTALQKARDKVDQLCRQQLARDRLARLSDSHRQVMQHLLLCTPHKCIASRLQIALRTVEKRRQEI
ncbi:MAG: response regulator transcription factor [Pirellulaceae bacterium]